MIVERDRLPEELQSIPAGEFRRSERDWQTDERFTTEPIGFYKDALRRLFSNKVSVVSLAAIVIIIALALIVPNVTGYGYTEQNVKQKNLPSKVPGLCRLGILDGTRVLTNIKKTSISDPKRYPEGCVLEVIREYKAGKQTVVDVKVNYYKYCSVPEGEYHWMGTDYLGRDILTRLFKGTRISLMIAFLSVVTNLIIGVIYGSVAGYYGGRVDLFLTHLAEGRPLFVRTPEAAFTLANFMRAHLYSAFGAVKLGTDILLKEENVRVDSITGHGGIFKTRGVAQRYLAAAMNAPVTVMETAGEGGPWGMALLALHRLRRAHGDARPLEAFLAEEIFSAAEGLTIEPDAAEAAGFEAFMERYRKLLPAEAAAVGVK